MNLRDVLVEDARARMLALAVPTPLEQVPLDEALGRTLAEPVVATRDQPPFPASAMDGWAVRSADAGPLTAVGESAAGHAYAGALNAGEAVRIFTGAPVPDGADSIDKKCHTKPHGFEGNGHLGKHDGGRFEG